MTTRRTYRHAETGVVAEYPERMARIYPSLIEVQAAISGCRDCGGDPVVIEEPIEDPIDSDDETLAVDATPADVAAKPAVKAAKDKE